MIQIDADFPGGNIVVEAIDGDTVRLHQDLRTTTEWWFYWHFRVRGAAGRTVRFSFTNRDVFLATGPAISEDGENWRWLGREIVVDEGFSYTFPAGVDSAFFSLGIPYLESTLKRFLATRPQIEQRVLCQTEAGRDAELLRLQSKTRKNSLLLTSRTHACEAMATYALEGILDFWLSDDSPEGRRLRDEIDIVCVPFVDKDGVEVGDQGKLRAPHDHNRDYIDRPLYATTRAIMDLIRSEGDRLRLGLDMHCPWIRGRRNEDFYIVGPPAPRDEPAMRLSKLIEQARQGDVPLEHNKYLPFGVDWNNSAQARTLSRYVSNHAPQALVGVSMEVPYGLSSGVIMTADRGRGIGRDVARAVARFIP